MNKINGKRGSGAWHRAFSLALAVMMTVLADWIPSGQMVVAEPLGNVELSHYAYTGGDYTAIDNAAKSVFYVEIYSTEYQAIGTGSGFVMFDERLFVTNQHVIESAAYLWIVDDDGRQYVLDQVVISDKEHDIAILQFPEGKNYRSLSYDTNFDQLKRGQPVLTIGSPKGLPGTVSDGIISAFPKFKGEDIRYIQITAPISHGSSGGCLLNEDLKVIGVTSAGVDEGQNLGFAIPVFIVEQLYNQWNKRDTVSLGTKKSWDTVGSGLHKKVSGSIEKPSAPAATSGKVPPPRTRTPSLVPSATVAPSLSITVSAENGYNRITWSAPSGASKYEVYRDGEIVGASRVTSFQDGGIIGGKSYEYQVKAYLSNGAVINSQKKTVKAVDSATPKTTSQKKTEVKVGQYITFGNYPQKAPGNDKTPIDWLVLEVQGDKALLLSKYGLDCKQYNTTRMVNTNWETCTLRSWLNEEFVNKAFTEREQTAILVTNVDNSVPVWWHENGGNNTQDKIFLLSISEAQKYLGVTLSSEDNMKSRAAPTAYAKKQGALSRNYIKTEDGSDAGWWWLRSPGAVRSPGAQQIGAAGVHMNGTLSENWMTYSSGCIRPALWINLESGVF